LRGATDFLISIVSTHLCGKWIDNFLNGLKTFKFLKNPKDSSHMRGDLSDTHIEYLLEK